MLVLLSGDVAVVAASTTVLTFVSSAVKQAAAGRALSALRSSANALSPALGCGWRDALAILSLRVYDLRLTFKRLLRRLVFFQLGPDFAYVYNKVFASWLMLIYSHPPLVHCNAASGLLSSSNAGLLAGGSCTWDTVVFNKMSVKTLDARVMFKTDQHSVPRQELKAVRYIVCCNPLLGGSAARTAERVRELCANCARTPERAREPQSLVPQFAAFCCSIPQFAAICCSVPQFAAICYIYASARILQRKTYN
ncbi:uncharacterized protein BDR25DRAFT_363798 [Lindgomyces ingoldianus]|uniref:Uncharacterized protein n=1 Tax=Lindgomyces ingoldianus TaxID=673940 RepID=A0ACB6Q738_9PLEO|nr:uncharacterized protein BDR25DRAFT_363798 [Lindgomyces ingoldianus]KAF2462626.1 hypothetical protein BDR25DRAFT_363798 [Lindgomyces ingoldianus]